LNTLVINGVIVRLEPIRHTPAGIPLLSFVLQHASDVIEAGFKRKVECEVNAVALGNIATDMTKQNIQIGFQIKAKGFLAKRSIKSTQLVLHIEKIEVI
jgi:primosomal replication protein N